LQQFGGVVEGCVEGGGHFGGGELKGGGLEGGGRTVEELSVILYHIDDGTHLAFGEFGWGAFLAWPVV